MRMHHPSGRWRLGLGLSLLTVFMWGLLPIALQITLEAMDGYTITWYRFMASAVLLGSYLSLRRGLPVSGPGLECSRLAGRGNPGPGRELRPLHPRPFSHLGRFGAGAHSTRPGHGDAGRPRRLPGTLRKGTMARPLRSCFRHGSLFQRQAWRDSCGDRRLLARDDPHFPGRRRLGDLRPRTEATSDRDVIRSRHVGRLFRKHNSPLSGRIATNGCWIWAPFASGCSSSPPSTP